MASTTVESLLESSRGVHFSGFHLDGEKKDSTVSADKNFQKQPFVIGWCPPVFYIVTMPTILPHFLFSYILLLFFFLFLVQ